ncbi:hypothetical protein GCM10023191_056290 [Actinoallomurus oryzae]|jgi:hypothetical protein|uniref:Uncharacterized protein n=1 Tax=Actinoallomurus oryzae TaxID=502180 RepID=A0ABP8QJB6_9ACTN
MRRSFEGGKWPDVDLYAAGGRGDIKTSSTPELERLMAAAGENGWSAVGRPAWLRAHRDRIRSLFLVVFGVEEHTVYRCLVTAVLDDGSGGGFTLDMSFDDFNGLPDVTPKELTRLAHLYLARFPPVELDPAQQEAWERLEHPE